MKRITFTFSGRKFVIMLALIVLIASLTLAFTACDEDNAKYKSAYQIAVENGFKGTELEWLESLKQAEPDLTFNITRDGRICFGKSDTGLSLNDLTSVSFAQNGQGLDGYVSVATSSFGGYFDKITYSIYRNGLKIGDNDYTDYIVKDAVIDTSNKLINIKAPYFGKYEVAVNYHKDNEIFFTKVSDISVKAEHYNFVYSNSTLPVLYAATEMVTMNHSYPTYVAIARNTTFDWGYLPENTYPIPHTTFTKKSTKLALFNEDGSEKTSSYMSWVNGKWGAVYANSSAVTNALKQMKYWIGELAALDENSTFSFYVDDTINGVALWWAYGNNIDPNRFNIKMYTEGTSTTSRLTSYSLFTYDAWEAWRQNYLNFIDGLKNGEDITSIWAAAKYAMVMNADSNVEHIVNMKPSLLSKLKTDDARYNEYRDLMDGNITQYTITDAMNKVKVEGKLRELEFLLRTRWIDSNSEEGSAAQYFKNDNGKKNLMIIGTSPNGEKGNGLSDTTLMTFMPYIVDLYGNDYNIFYKGHPSYPINRFDDGRTEYFNNNNIKVLPNAVPAETYMLLYEDVYIGGYSSTTMVSSLKGQTLFFLGEEDIIKSSGTFAQFFDTEAEDYTGIFEETIFITKSSLNNA